MMHFIQKLLPPEDLESRILARIGVLNQRALRIRAFIWGGLGGLSMVAFVFGIKEAITEFTQSGFTEYASLAFSDSATLALYWKEFLLSLLESLPLMGLIVSVAALLAFLWSVAGLIRVAGPAFTHQRHA